MHEKEYHNAAYVHVSCLTCKHVNHLSQTPTVVRTTSPITFDMFCQVCDTIRIFEREQCPLKCYTIHAA